MRPALTLTAAISSLTFALAALALGHGSPIGGSERETIEHGSGLAGTLDAIPDRVERGGRVAAAVRNSGEEPMYFGLGFEVRRLIDDRWVRIRRPFTTNAIRAIGLRVGPRRTGGPRYGDVIDRYRLRAELPPGKYKLVKKVGPGLSRLSLRLNSRFVIVRKAPPRG